MTVTAPARSGLIAPAGASRPRSRSRDRGPAGEKITADDLARTVAEIVRTQTQPLLERIAQLKRATTELQQHIDELRSPSRP